MSKAQAGYTNKPSKISLVLEAGTAFDAAVYVKPPSQNARKVFSAQMMDIDKLEKSGNFIGVTDLLTNAAVNLILITNCDDKGVRYILTEDKDFLVDDLDPLYFEKLVAGACKIMGLPKAVEKGLLLKIGQLDDEEETSEEENFTPPQSSNQTTLETQQV